MSFLFGIVRSIEACGAERKTCTTRTHTHTCTHEPHISHTKRTPRVLHQTRTHARTHSLTHTLAHMYTHTRTPLTPGTGAPQTPCPLTPILPPLTHTHTYTTRTHFQHSAPVHVNTAQNHINLTPSHRDPASVQWRERPVGATGDGPRSRSARVTLRASPLCTTGPIQARQYFGDLRRVPVKCEALQASSTKSLCTTVSP